MLIRLESLHHYIVIGPDLRHLFELEGSHFLEAAFNLSLHNSYVLVQAKNLKGHLPIALVIELQSEYRAPPMQL